MNTAALTAYNFTVDYFGTTIDITVHSTDENTALEHAQRTYLGHRVRRSRSVRRGGH